MYIYSHINQLFLFMHNGMEKELIKSPDIHGSHQNFGGVNQIIE